MRVVLVRHGETDWNGNGRLMGRLDVPLNENGRKQAETLREKLANMRFDCCYSSPLSRARETAEIVCRNKCEVIYDDRLQERDGGAFQGEVIDNWGDYHTDNTVETDAEILGRAANFWQEIRGKDYDTVLIVSHNGLLKNLRHCILGRDGDVDYGSGNLANCGFEVYDIEKEGYDKKEDFID